MQCPACQTENPDSATRCESCNTGFGDNPPTIDTSEDATPIPATAWSAAPAFRGSRPSLSATQITPGMEFGGRYKILQLLGQGGMGAVYKARDCELDRLVALKVIRPDLASDESILSRFKRELILAREITHKNVIRIFDLGNADGVKFITMEFVEGQDLYSLTKDGRPFTLPEKVKIVLQVCRALDAAHSEGVVHRDLKPQNIMVEANGRVVVMDFGIARSMEQAGMTSTGAMIGTPAYMSPEQAMGEKVDTRSDLFALGVIFYELLTGKSPYEAETIVGLALKRIHERPQPPIERDPQVPQALSDVVLKCLAVELNQRYQTAQEIIRDLESWEGFPSTFTIVGVPPLHPRRLHLRAVDRPPQPRHRAPDVELRNDQPAGG